MLGGMTFVTIVTFVNNIISQSVILILWQQEANADQKESSSFVLCSVTHPHLGEVEVIHPGYEHLMARV